MSNINNNPNEDIDTILKVLNNAKIAKEYEKTAKQIGAQVQMALYDRRYEALQQNNQQQQHPRPKIVEPAKSIGRPKTSRRLEQLKAGIGEILDMIKNHPIATTLIASVTAFGIFIILPTLKTNSQINDLTNKLGNNLEKGKYVQQQDGIFKKYKLNIEPSDFIESMKLTSNSHMRLYILSTVIQDSDFDNILRALGYNGIEDYVKKLGYRHNDDYRASEQYSMEYEDKLRDLIKELNKHPELVSTYLDEYPELRFIYDTENTYLIDGVIGTTRDNGRSL